MVGRGAKFSQKIELAIAALLSHRSLEEAARAVGITTHTLLRWMKEPEFRAMYQEARRTAFSQAIGRLQEASGAAVTTTLKIMLDASAPPAIRLRAAEIVLEHAGKAVDLENLGARIPTRGTGHATATAGEVTLVETTPRLGPPPSQLGDVPQHETDEGDEAP
jgi:transposase-like protein